MALFDTAWYANSTGYTAVTPWAATTAVAAGALRRQLAAPAVNSERVFVCIVAGTTGSTEPAWVLTRGAKTTDGTVTWMECTGISAVNGDITNTINWTALKAAGTPSLGVIVKRNNSASYQICTTAGTLGATEPSFSDTAGVTTTETSATTVWTSLGVVGNWTTGGAAPHARLANACATNWFAAGNTIYVGDNHAESQATAITIAPTGSASTVGKFLCHNHSGSYPPASGDITTGATVSTTAVANIIFNSTTVGLYFYGIAFKLAVGQSSASTLNITPPSCFVVFSHCSFELATTGAGATITLGTGSSAETILWDSTTVKFANVGQALNVVQGSFYWQNTGLVLGTGSLVPNNLLNASTGAVAVTLEALDLSQLTGNVVGTPISGASGSIIIKDCKLNASALIGVPTIFGIVTQLVRCDSGATSYKSARYQYEGTETTETSITRVGGAADPTGQAQSRKIVTTANVQWLRPFKAEPYAIWNAVTGANVTVTVCGTVNSGTLPNNDDIWLECEYVSDTASPLGKIVTTTKSNVLAANAAVASDGSAWNVFPYTSWNPFDLLGINLSNGNLTATNTASPSGVRAKDGSASGKYYWEVTVSTWAQSGTSVGFGLASATLNAGSTIGSATVARTGGITVNNTASGSSLGALSAGNTIGIALDISNNLCWFRAAPSGNWNGSGTANPATGAGGVSISAISGMQFPIFLGNGSGEVATANFGASTFIGVVPSGGFIAGFSTSWSPFKLTTTLSSPQPGMAGYIHVRVRAAKASTTFYLDPQVQLS